MEELTFNARKWWKGEWDLYRQGQLAASLVVKNKWSWNLAEVQIGEQRWEVGYKGWCNHFFVRDAEGRTLTKTVSGSFWKSAMEIELSGRRYILSSNWKGRYRAAEHGDIVVATVVPHWWKCAGTLALRDPNNEMELLLGMLLFYRMKIEEMNTAIVVAASGGAIAVGS